MRKLKSFIWLLAIGGSTPVMAGTCAMCKQALESGGGAGLLDGFYWSIVIIGGIPIAVMGFGIWYISKLWKAESRRHSGEGQNLS